MIAELSEEQVAENLAQVRARIAAAVKRAGRTDEVALVAVTKTHTAAYVSAAMNAGVTDVGENRVQEAVQKREELGAVVSQARWHLIGHLQSNKAKLAVQHFDLVHSVDSLELARELNRHTEKAAKLQPILLQFNVSGEESKFGSDPAAARQLAKAVVDSCPGLLVDGFMTMAPFSDNPEDARPHFRALRQLAEQIRSEVPSSPNFSGKHLSMGMTGDFEVAIEEGATLVRIGSAIFGNR